MIRISTAITGIINENPFIQFGFANDLINLTQLARFIHPLVQARTKKEVSHSAILMALSRAQRRIDKIMPSREQFHIQNLSIDSDLCVLTFEKSRKIHQQINKLYRHIQQKKGYITITEGVSEITIIIHHSFLEIVDKEIGDYKKKTGDIASIGIKFSDEYIQIPGLLYSVLQQITAQNINVIEIASTYTEFILYLKKKDIKLAFDTLFECFNA